MPTTLPFNLDIWVEPDLARHLKSGTAPKRVRGFKAVNIGWRRDDSLLDAATFQRGAWESIFLALDPDAMKVAQSELK